MWKMDWRWPSIFLLCNLLIRASAVQYYAVIGPKVVRPNSEYHVAVSTAGVSTPQRILVELDGTLDNGEAFNASEIAWVEPYSTRIVKLEIGDTSPGKYKLRARGLSDFYFENSTDVQYVHKSYSVFIQTDRAIYKPGSKVMFRCVVLDSRLRPATTRRMDIYIADGAGNRIKQYTKPPLTRGVYSDEIELSASPVLGDWRIVVNVGDQIFEKGFQVAEYVLPKFEVSIDTTKDVTFKEGKIFATVYAKYTYGKPVKGEATVTAYPDIFSGVIQPIYQNPIRKIVPIDGKVTVEFDIIKDLKLMDEYTRPVKIEVAVEEALTSRRQNVSEQVMVHKYKYNMELIKTSEYYKPGLKYTAILRLHYHDGSPVRDKTNPVQISYGYTFNQSAHTNITRMLDDNGMIELNFYPPIPINNLSYPLNIEAQYLNRHEWFPPTNQAMSPNNTYIQAMLKTKDPKVNQDIEIEVNSTHPMKYLSYKILGRGDILYANSMAIQDKTTASFKFLATYVMAPTAHVLVSYVRDDGEVVADSLDIELDGTLQNFVDIKVTPGETNPGANVDLTITSKPNSYVGILGVDQRSLLLKSGNDISMDQVKEELRSYDHSEMSPYDNYGFRASYWRTGSATAQDVFQKTGVVVLTNGFVYNYFPILYYRSSMDGVAYASAAASPSPTAIPSEKMKVRKNFPETWLWQTLDAGMECIAGQPGFLEGRVTGSPHEVSTLRPDNGPPLVHRIVTRPPLAGPYAFSRIPTPVWNKPRVFLMHDILNTWLFANFSSGIEGKTVIKRQVPDSITSWVLTAFSVDSVHGFGLIEEPRKLKVFQPFFVSVDLPYSVIRGEIVAIPVIVFNYMDKDLIADITLSNSDNQFEFAEVSNEVHDQPRQELYRKKRVEVKRQSGASVSFMIIPKTIGPITIKASATSILAGDSVEHKLLVKAEGETQYRNKAIFVDLRDSRTFKTNITVDIPNNIVPGSEYIEVSAVGDILGPSIPNLANLIKMPFGCGEQNMLNFVPNIVILNYLKNTNQLNQAVQSKALKYLEIGYQQELTYKHTDGSFSAFGMSDPSGSTWLTAFVAKSFKQAAEYITIESNIIDEALQWLANKQAPNGSFPEVGKISHKDMQGGAAKGLALTAYTLTAFLETSDSSDKYKNTINKAIDYIVRNIEDLDDVYALSLCAYVLNLVNHHYEETVFNILETKAQTKDDLKWWSKPVPEGDKNPWYSLPRSVDVEMTAYNLLTYLRRNLVADSLSLMKWLVKQRNAEGGFASTQDTVIGIYALSKLGEKLATKDNSISITYNYVNGGKSQMNINPSNSMILQKLPLPLKVRSVNITANGNGFAILQISSHYNLNVTGAWPLFTLDPQVDKISNADHLQLSICSAFVPTKEANESNMAVMEVSLPSGFTVDMDSLPSLEVSQHVKRVETRNGDTMVVLYFDKMIRKEYCPTISAFKTHKVAKQKPVPVTIYDYYDSSRRARVFYEPKMATLCDICEGEDCGDVCVKQANVSEQINDGNSHAATVFVDIKIFLILYYLISRML